MGQRVPRPTAGWQTLVGESAPDHTVVLGAQYEPLWMSASVIALLDLDHEESRTAGLAPRVDPENLGALAEAVVRAQAAPGRCHPITFRATTAARDRWVTCSGWMASIGVGEERALMVRFREVADDEGEPAPQELDPFYAFTKNSTTGFALVGPRGGLGYRNEAFASLFPAERAGWVGDLPDLIDEEHRDRTARWLTGLAGGSAEPLTVSIGDDGLRWFRFDVAPLDPNNPYGMAAGITVHDVTDEVEVGTALRQVLDLVPYLVFAVDADGCIQFANRATADFMEVEPDDLQHRSLDEALGGRSLAGLLPTARQLIENGTPVLDQQDAVERADGSVAYLRTSFVPYRDARTGIPTLLAVSADVTREVTSEVRLTALGRNMPDLAVVVDADGTRSFVSHSVETLLGWRPTEWLALREEETIHPDDHGTLRPIADPRRTEPGTRGRVEVRLCHRNGSWRWFEVSAVNLSHEPAVGGVLMFGRDISDRKAQDLRLRHEASHDPLSGLLNRGAVIEELEVALAEARADGSTVGVLFCDLDNFKLVNDGLGHEVGDELLRRIAHHIEGSIRAEDVVGRLGGDEFLVVARAVGGDAALLQLADRLAAAVTDDLRSTPFPVSVSIGAAAAPAGHSNAGALIRDADAAMYRAKTSGKARAEVFRHEMRDRAERHLEVGRMLRSALDEGWFVVHYQPVFARRGEVWELRALEALARCPLPLGGYLAPDEFIPVAEQTGMIARLGRRVAELVCDDLTRWGSSHPTDNFQVWINTSVQELDGGELSAGMVERLGRAGIDPRRLGMEVTESALATGHPVALAELARLRATGLSVIIDDFGAGYSSLRSLKTYPADVVKIDRSFVADLVDEPADLAIVRSVVEIGRVTGIEIVAEGVETQDQLRTLSALGCPVVQGYLLARPVPAAVVDEQLDSWLRGEVAGLKVP